MDDLERIRSWAPRKLPSEFLRSRKAADLREGRIVSARDVVLKTQTESAADPVFEDYRWPWFAELQAYQRHNSIGCKDFFPMPERR